MPKYKEKSKSFVVEKIVEWLQNGKIIDIQLKEQMSEILLERDYNTIAKDLTEYRKGEITKKLEQENDPEKRIELMMQRAVAKKNLRRKKRR